MIPSLVLLRGTAFLLTLGLIFFTGGERSVYNERWESWVYILGLSHYLCALVYSKKQIHQLPRAYDFSWKAALTVLVTSPLLILDGFSLLFLFGFHHAFNEAYLVDRATRVQKDSVVRSLRTASIVLYFLVYLFLLKKEPGLDRVPPQVLVGILFFGYAVFFYFLFRARRALSRSEFIDNCAAEIFSLFIIGFSFYFDVKFHHVVAYHFILWAIRPLPRFLRSDPAGLSKYLALTGLLFGAFYLISPMGWVYYPLQGSFFYMQFAIWSYLHITLSFALSDFHPGWIVRFFRPSRTLRPGVVKSGNDRLY